MSEKIYCINCQWFEVECYTRFGYICKHPTNKKFIDTPISQVPTHIWTCEEYNKNNNCTLFKKKIELF